MTETIVLEQTCEACPEQYDAFIMRNGEKEQVGYLRLRHGYFSVEYPDFRGELLYEAGPKGDGMFDSDEREFYLNEAKNAILKRINQN